MTWLWSVRRCCTISEPSVSIIERWIGDSRFAAIWRQRPGIKNRRLHTRRRQSTAADRFWCGRWYSFFRINSGWSRYTVLCSNLFINDFSCLQRLTVTQLFRYFFHWWFSLRFSSAVVRTTFDFTKLVFLLNLVKNQLMTRWKWRA